MLRGVVHGLHKLAQIAPGPRAVPQVQLVHEVACAVSMAVVGCLGCHETLYWWLPWLLTSSAVR